MFRFMLKVMVSTSIFLYRMTGGAIGGKMRGASVLLLTTIGRKSGQARTIPLTYFKEGSAYMIVASYAGQPKHPAWFLNLQSQAEATIQIMRQQIRVKAETANPERRRELWERLVKEAPGYAEYQKRTTREIPIVLLYPIDASGEAKSA